ncbi:hypothetical protein CSUI_005739, partial [Cystoisospora suis]
LRSALRGDPRGVRLFGNPGQAADRASKLGTVPSNFFSFSDPSCACLRILPGSTTRSVNGRNSARAPVQTLVFLLMRFQSSLCR